VVTSLSDGEGNVVVVAASTSFLLSTLSVVVIDEDKVEDDELGVSSSSAGNVGKSIDILESFELTDDDVLLSSSSSSSSSSPKGDSPNTLVPVSDLWTPGALLPPRRLLRTTGPRIRMTSATIELTFCSIC